MSARKVALRYAKALIEVLDDRNALDEIQSLLEFCDMVAANSQLNRVFTSVTIAPVQMAGVVAAIAGKAGLPDLVTRFLRVLAENGRMGILPEVKVAIAEKLDERNNIRPVTLITAVKLSDAELKRFASSMETFLKSKVRIEPREDASILGGAIAQVGSVVYDGSLSGQLRGLRKELVKEN